MKRIETNGVPVYIWDEEMEQEGIDQAKNVAKMPFILHHVAVMADGHVGYGVPIGCVIAARGVILPYAVGNDIGCGVISIPTSFNANSISKTQLVDILQEIKNSVPHGKAAVHTTENSPKWDGFDVFRDKEKFKWLDLKKKRWIRRSLGTLGGGNHFIEIQEAVEGTNAGKLYIMIHSGSRNLGAQICVRYHNIAKESCATAKVKLPDPNLAYLRLNTLQGTEYLSYMQFALEFAKTNRELMLNAVKRSILTVLGTKNSVAGQIFGKTTNVHHNYATPERHYGNLVMVHRKGAIFVGSGAIGLIPGSQGTASYIVRGKGSPESFNSCSHGSGRLKGRNDACRSLSVEEETKAMSGVVFSGWGTKTIKGTSYDDLSEAPGAYKNISRVVELQKGLVEVVTKLRPLAVFKG